jgi:hypothetical protein
MMRTCYGVSNDGYHELFHYMRQFPDTKTYFKKAGWNALYNFYSWVNVYKQLKNAVKSDNVIEIAKTTGEAVHLFFAVDPSLTLSKPYSIGSKITDFGVNWFNGTGITAGPEVNKYVNDYNFFDALLNAVTEALHSTEVGAEEKAVNAIADVLDAFYPLNVQFFDGTKAMKYVVGQYMRIVTAPLEVFFNTIFWFRDIFSLMTSTVNCTFKFDMKCAGFKSGRMFYRVFYKQR